VPRPEVIALFGPTGVGKTAVALELADLLRRRGENPIAISADALQVYDGLEILTGAPSAGDLARLEHRLLGIVPITSEFSAGEFAALAHLEIDEALAGRRRPIVVGGTGLYLRAALTDLEMKPAPPPELRQRLERQAADRGPQALHKQLALKAPVAASRIEATDRSRVIRALELIEMGEEPPAARDAASQLWTAETRKPTILAGLTMDRDALYERIDARVDQMVAAGAPEEVHRAEAAGGVSRTARKALGYDELLVGDVEEMKRRTRRYARRQLTWMRRLPGIEIADCTGRKPDDVAREIAALAPAR
jgi:tRNA dimethylallyltransferase